MGLRGVIRGRTIELEQEPPLPDGTQVEVDLHPATDPLFDRLCALWQLNLTEPCPPLKRHASKLRKHLLLLTRGIKRAQGAR